MDLLLKFGVVLHHVNSFLYHADQHHYQDSNRLKKVEVRHSYAQVLKFGAILADGLSITVREVFYRTPTVSFFCEEHRQDEIQDVNKLIENVLNCLAPCSEPDVQVSQIIVNGDSSNDCGCIFQVEDIEVQADQDGGVDDIEPCQKNNLGSL